MYQIEVITEYYISGTEVKSDLVQVLQNRLDDAVLEVLSVMLARNPMCKLSPEDIHFIQKPNRLPESTIQVHPLKTKTKSSGLSIPTIYPWEIYQCVEKEQYTYP